VLQVIVDGQRAGRRQFAVQIRHELVVRKRVFNGCHE
jgi:hypothetical protein